MSFSFVIVDDDPAFRAVARALLTARGFDVVGQADDVSTGIAAVSAHVPHAVLLDLQLPDGDGLSAAGSIHASNPEVRVLLTSAGERTPSPVELADAGVSAFVPKEQLATTDLVSLLSL
ncbi:response regulator [uncultured Leifsonia sp.]|uniref:response regulator n=1 Tax=uncultured Leifsonia sp. TaxID=340359 RepID=UPI0028D48EFC|nr:response regulator [uncultured Leifsonia sp.]